ncbi:AAA family ATPase, partial [bacterium]|nr:AAA family ATPase [bacterium]
KSGNENVPTNFEFVFKYNKNIYVYGFTINRESILEEHLNLIGKTTEKIIFERITLSNKQVEVKLGNKIKNTNDTQFLKFVAKSTRPNKLFLTQAEEQNVKAFSDAYDWFKSALTIIYPETKYEKIDLLVNATQKLCEIYSNFFELFDTGIEGILTEELDLQKDMTEIPGVIKNEIMRNLKKDHIGIINLPNHQRYTVYIDDNKEFKALKLFTRHKMDSGKEINFEIKNESDGTKRLIDLIPALLSLINQEMVFIIDELNRSLHPNLTYNLIKVFLENSKDNESQLIATTHEINLLDLNLLRRDEIWFIEKDKDQQSQLYSLEEFKPRYDKDIKKGYMLGRFGAIPVIHKIKDLGWV